MQYTIKSSDLNQEAINAIQERFGDANLVINVEPNSQEDILTDENCWKFIDKLDWNAGEDSEIVSPLVIALANESIAHIYQFADWLAKKLWLLDTPVYAENLIKQDGFLSVDDFLYARCAVVANGQSFYDSIFNHPEQFPVSVTFEPLLYTPIRAYQKKTDKEMVYIPLFNYETYGNKEAWGK